MQLRPDLADALASAELALACAWVNACMLAGAQVHSALSGAVEVVGVAAAHATQLALLRTAKSGTHVLLMRLWRDGSRV